MQVDKTRYCPLALVLLFHPILTNFHITIVLMKIAFLLIENVSIKNFLTAFVRSTLVKSQNKNGQYTCIYVCIRDVKLNSLRSTGMSRLLQEGLSCLWINIHVSIFASILLGSNALQNVLWVFILQVYFYMYV